MWRSMEINIPNQSALWFASWRSSSLVESHDHMTFLVPADHEQDPHVDGRSCGDPIPGNFIWKLTTPSQLFPFWTLMPAKQPVKRSCRVGATVCILKGCLQISRGGTEVATKRQGNKYCNLSTSIRCFWAEVWCLATLVNINIMPSLAWPSTWGAANSPSSPASAAVCERDGLNRVMLFDEI